MAIPLRSFVLPLSLLALVACGEHTGPVQPDTSADPSPATPSFAVAGNTWILKAPVPKPPPDIASSGRMALAAGAANNAAGRPTVYVFGGVTTDNEYHFGIDAYDPTTNTWARRGVFGRAWTNGVGKIGNKLYISGGGVVTNSRLEADAKLLVYDPVANRLIRKANMPRATGKGVSGVINGKLYVLAGLCENLAAEEPPYVDCRSLYRYDPVTNQWATLARAPHPHLGGAAGVINGKLYVAGGGWGRILANLDVYDPVTNTWKALAPMPEARWAVGGAVLTGKLYVIGGVGTSGISGPKNKVFAYNPATNTWQVRASLLRGRHDLAATQIKLLTGQSHIFALGGCCQFRGQNEMYTP